MAANTSPIFTLTPNIGHTAPTAANTNGAGTGTVGTDMFLGFTAGTNGSFVTRVRFFPVATAASTTTTASLARVFFSTVGTGSVTANTNAWAIGEIALPSVVADSPTLPNNTLELMLNFAMPSGTFLLITNHVVPAASTYWQTIVFGGDY